MVYRFGHEMVEARGERSLTILLLTVARHGDQPDVPCRTLPGAVGRRPRSRPCRAARCPGAPPRDDGSARPRGRTGRRRPSTPRDCSSFSKLASPRAMSTLSSITRTRSLALGDRAPPSCGSVAVGLSADGGQREAARRTRSPCRAPRSSPSGCRRASRSATGRASARCPAPPPSGPASGPPGRTARTCAGAARAGCPCPCLVP